MERAREKWDPKRSGTHNYWLYISFLLLLSNDGPILRWLQWTVMKNEKLKSTTVHSTEPDLHQGA
jgi:hypothetical protein